MPGQAYNPLFLYGAPGVGKTHLLHSIANYIDQHGRGLSVRYVTGEQFTNEFVQALQRPGGAGRLQAALPPQRRAPRRRRPVPRAQGPHGGRVLPHLQRALRSRQPARARLRPASRATSRPSRRACASASSPAWSPTSRARTSTCARGGPPHARRPRRSPVHPSRRPRGHRRAHRGQHPRPRGSAHPRRRIPLPDRASSHAVAHPRCPGLPRARHPATPAHRPRDPGGRVPRRSASRSTSSSPRAAPPAWCMPARSPCTSRASSPTETLPSIGRELREPQPHHGPPRPSLHRRAHRSRPRGEPHRRRPLQGPRRGPVTTDTPDRLLHGPAPLVVHPSAATSAHIVRPPTS